MNNIFQPLDNDTDVLLLDKDTYTVSRFKELIHEKFAEKFHAQFSSNLTVANIFMSVTISEARFQIEDITWKSSSKGINCQILRVGSRGWQPGRVRISASTEIIANRSNSPIVKINVFLEYYPDEPLEPESPLDDIRKMMQAT